MAVTAKQIALQLGLSESAVSLALHNKPGVSTKTKKTILETAAALGYDFTRITPLRAANGIIHTICYNKRNIFNMPFYTEIISGIETGFQNSGYKLIIDHLYDADDIQAQLERILGSGCDGIILLGTQMEKMDFSFFSFLDIPIVLLDSYFHSVKMDCVVINNINGACQAVKYLIKKRGAQPGYLRSACSISNFDERADGFYKALRESGFSLSHCIEHRVAPYMDAAYADMLTILDQGEQLASCYFADNDEIAIGAIKAFHERGYRIPEDIAVIGFDNIPFSSYTVPPLTTVNVPKTYMGQLAAQRMLTVLSSAEYHPVKIEVTTNLIIRKSI